MTETYKDLHARLKPEDMELLQRVENKYWAHLGHKGEPFRFRAQTIRFMLDLADRYLEKHATN